MIPYSLSSSVHNAIITLLLFRTFAVVTWHQQQYPVSSIIWVYIFDIFNVWITIIALTTKCNKIRIILLFLYRLRTCMLRDPNCWTFLCLKTVKHRQQPTLFSLLSLRLHNYDMFQSSLDYQCFGICSWIRPHCAKRLAILHDHLWNLNRKRVMHVLWNIQPNKKSKDKP